MLKNVPVQRIVGILMTILCIAAFIFNPISRYFTDKPLFIWPDLFLLSFFVISVWSIYVESVIFKIFHVLCFGIAGVMTFLLHPGESLVQFLGLMIFYNLLPLSFVYGFFKKAIFLKIIIVALSFWGLIYLSIHDVVDSLLWSFTIDIFSTILYLMVADLIRKARILDEQEKKDMEDKLISSLEASQVIRDEFHKIEGKNASIE
jgi:hypothetical protein